MDPAIFAALQRSPLTRGMDSAEIQALLEHSQAYPVTYQKNEIIFHEGEAPRKLFILLQGSVRILKSAVSGREVFITEIQEPGDLFGEVYLFIARKAYDMYAMAQEKTLLLTISNEMFSLQAGSASHISAQLQQNLMKIFAGKAYFLSHKLKVLASGSLREKIVRFLWQKNPQENWVSLPETREAMASYLAVTRPSLSRELSAMQAEGILHLAPHGIQILDLTRFESYL